MKLNGKVTDNLNFYQGHEPHGLVKKYGSPLYVYNERIFRENCKNLMQMCPYPDFAVNYSIKANSNLTLLAIAKSEGLRAETTSTGEIAACLAAGYNPSDIFYITNNASDEEMLYAIGKGILFSADSLSQLERYGRLNPGSKVAARFNPGVGSGHHGNVVTGGKGTKFGINEEYIPQVKEILTKHKLKLCGINQHIGSHILDYDLYTESIHRIMQIAAKFNDLDFIDLGGGFGIPYRKQEDEKPLDLLSMGKKLAEYMNNFSKSYGKKITFMIEPGKYVPCESGVLLGTVHSIKNNGNEKFIGTDLGFSVLIRPVLYGAYHEIEVYRDGTDNENESETVNVVGNICESGDFIAKNRKLPKIREDDVLGVLDAGAYGYSMASQYNFRLRPAEVLIRQNGDVSVIRHRDTIEDLLRNMPLNL